MIFFATLSVIFGLMTAFFVHQSIEASKSKITIWEWLQFAAPILTSVLIGVMMLLVECFQHFIRQPLGLGIFCMGLGYFVFWGLKETFCYKRHTFLYYEDGGGFEFCYIFFVNSI
jgi:hypothetical protein